jgi:anaerobic selenocysteine-containing dehydrogenase
MAGFAVNALLGNINKPGGISLLPPVEPMIPLATPRSELYAHDLVSWLSGAEKSDILILHEANPVYALPEPEAVKTALDSIPFKVSFSTFLDESAALCDLVLPIGMGLERFDDLETPYGCGRTIYCLTAPVVEPRENVRGTGNTLLYIARQMGLDLGCELYQDLLKAKAQMFASGGIDSLAAGQAAVLETRAELASFSLRPEIVGQALAEAPPSGGKLRLAPYARLNLGTAKTGIPPCNTVTIRAEELADGVTMSALMNRKTAAANGLGDGDPVLVDAGRGKVRARLRIFEGVMNETVALCLGFGHTALDEFSRKKGANVMELMTAAPESNTGLSVWAQTSVTVAKA